VISYVIDYFSIHFGWLNSSPLGEIYSIFILHYNSST
jgi:hypothetical protein